MIGDDRGAETQRSHRDRSDDQERRFTHPGVRGQADPHRNFVSGSNPKDWKTPIISIGWADLKVSTMMASICKGSDLGARHCWYGMQTDIGI